MDKHNTTINLGALKKEYHCLVLSNFLYTKPEGQKILVWS